MRRNNEEIKQKTILLWDGETIQKMIQLDPVQDAAELEGWSVLYGLDECSRNEEDCYVFYLPEEGMLYYDDGYFLSPYTEGIALSNEEVMEFMNGNSINSQCQ